MKVIVEYEVEPSADNPEAELEPYTKEITLTLRRRITNADATVFSLAIPDKDGKVLKVWAEAKKFVAMERVK